jgi:hypothetical protein
MKATELIEKLQNLIKQHGNQNISFADNEGSVEATDVYFVTEEESQTNPEGFCIR